MGRVEVLTVRTRGRGLHEVTREVEEAVARPDGLGTWQGIYVWGHRRRGSTRELLVHVAG